MRKKILITRHGESEANIQQIISNRDLPHKLTAIGRSQALALAENLVKWDVKIVFTSPILRAVETASIIAGELGVSLIKSTALREFDCGALEGRGDEAAWEAHREIIRVWDEEQNDTYCILPDGESFNDMKARFLPFISNIVREREHIPGNVLLVSHGGLLHQMLPLVLANVDRAFTKQHPLGNCDLVFMHQQDTNLICTEWAGIKLV